MSTLLYKMGVFSDAHLRYNNYPERREFLAEAIDQMMNEGMNYVVSCGDTIDLYPTSLLSAECAYKTAKDAGYTPGVDYFAGLGNHENNIASINAEQRMDAINQLVISEYHDYAKPHYVKIGKDWLYIMNWRKMGNNAGNTTSFLESDVLHLENFLIRDDVKDCRVFVVQHAIPKSQSRTDGSYADIAGHAAFYGDTTNWIWDDYSERFCAAIKSHGNVVWLHGHSHFSWTLGNVVDTKWAKYSVHVPSVGLCANSSRAAIAGQSEWLEFDVYDDQIIIIPWQTIDNGDSWQMVTSLIQLLNIAQPDDPEPPHPIETWHCYNIDGEVIAPYDIEGSLLVQAYDIDGNPLYHE